MTAPMPRAHGARGLHPHRALTLIELLIVVILFAVVVSALMPSISSSGGCSRRMVCASNIKGLGTSMKIYANDYNDDWPSVSFDETAIGQIDYTIAAGSGAGSVRSPSRTQLSVGEPGGTRQLSVTRPLWMLVRSGDMTPKMFICPTSGDSIANENDIDRYYDFAGPSQISYGYQVPYGPPLTRAHEIMDPRVALAADKGPYTNANVAIPKSLPVGTGQDNPKAWQPFNSPNHGSEGQNVLYGDGHATFEKTPFNNFGNIYTVATGNAHRKEYFIGESPWKHSAPPYLPHDVNGEPQCTTDSLIYP